MKILVCARGYNSYSENKIGDFELDQAKALKDAGCDVRIVSLDLRSPRRRRPHGAKKFALCGMRCVTVNYYCSILPGSLEDKMGRYAAKKAFSIACKDGWKPDIVHAHFTEIASAVCDEALMIGAKLVITEHSSAMNCTSPKETSLRQALYSYPRADKLISVSSSLALNIKKATGISSDVIGNIVDLSIFEELSEGSSDGRFRFVSCGNLREIKGFDILLKAFSKLDKYALLTVFGDGELEAPLKALCNKLGISDRVIFKGRQPRTALASEYARSDAFVLASRSETFGVAFIEAMSVGLPVVATKCGGPESFVCDLNGRLAEVNSVESLAQQMNYIMQNKNSFDGKKIKEFVVSRYSPSNVAGQLINTYTALLNDPAG